jgi:hypothetical protein
MRRRGEDQRLRSVRTPGFRLIIGSVAYPLGGP